MIRKATKDDLKGIADLHILTLPDSIFVKLGRFFLERYYHTMLVSVAHVVSYVYEYNGRIVGFIAMATSHKLFYRQIRKDIASLSFALLRTMIVHPASIREIFRAAGFLIRKDDLITCDAEGELLQIAVDHEYRVRLNNGEYSPFYKETGVKIAGGLFLKVMTELKARGVKDFRIMTGDANDASNRFYAKMGCKKFSTGVKVFDSPTSVYRGRVGEIIDTFHHTGV